MLYSWKFKQKQILLYTAFLLKVLVLSGCGDFFAEKPTELEAQKILRNLNTIQSPKISEQQISQTMALPPKIVKQVVGGREEYKLFYYCKYHTAEELAALVKNQFITTIQSKTSKNTVNSSIENTSTDGSGTGSKSEERSRTSQITDFTASSNIATNQLIVRCPLKDDADSVLQFLQHVDVQPVQVKIDCLISEVYADITMDWETTLFIKDLFGLEGVSLGGKVAEDGSLLPAFPGAALRDAARASFGLKAGYIKNDDFRVLVDMLVSKGYLKILMNPTLEVVNGKTAVILTSEHVPLDQISTVTRDGFLTTETVYIDVIDSLKITPHVFADGYIGLETTALTGSKSTPEGVKQIPIVTKRQVENQENRIRQGESLVIGGIRKTEKRSVIRGVPFLKDLPVIGVLFSSKDFEERGKEILFIITPSISTGGVPAEKMIDQIRETHTNIRYQRSFGETLMDPFGKKDVNGINESSVGQQSDESEDKSSFIEKESLKNIDPGQTEDLQSDERTSKIKKDSAR